MFMTELVVAGVLLSGFAFGKFLFNRFFRKSMQSKGVTYNLKGDVVSCLFCRIQKREEPGNIAYEDDKFVVFHTIAPASKIHFLVTPREHIRNLRSLQGEEGALVVEDLVRIGRIALGEHGDGALYCFHVPPFNSIDHLHLHAIAQPERMTFLGRGKYTIGTWYCHSAEQVIQRLRAEQTACKNCGEKSCACRQGKKRRVAPIIK
ncbi:HIT domain-containing protein [archaeon]|nr:MAG: HIT domain-containing protein [archaeon]